MSGQCDANLSNWDCKTNYSCMGPKINSYCTACSKLREGFQCKCTRGTGSWDIRNCTQCAAQGCQQCINQYKLKSDLSCEPNFCSTYIYQCADGQKCPTGAVERTACEPCVENDNFKCKCGKKQNCQLCDVNSLLCTKCQQGYFLQDGYCIIQENICDSYGQNSLCYDDHFCLGSFGETCLECKLMSENQNCRCKGKNALNCVDCDGEKCKKCIQNYFPEFGICKTNLCGQVLNTLNCAFGNYCKQGSSVNQECMICDGMQECNCGTIRACKFCGTEKNTCSSCFHGYALVNNICEELKNSCKNDYDSSQCDDNYFCDSVKGDLCTSCSLITMHNSCECGKLAIQNCSECINEVCTKCVSGFYPFNNVCIVNQCISGQPSENCAFNNFCPDTHIGATVDCQICADNQFISCNCSGAQNCSTCDMAQNRCKTCINGYTIKSSQCVIKDNICDYENTSSFCAQNQFCDGNFGDTCISCNTIFLDKACKCGSNLQLNCLECSGSLCKKCIKGYEVLDGQCKPNFCDKDLSHSQCLFGYICAKGSQPGDECQQCQVGQIVGCNCDLAQNCETCGEIFSTCKTCIVGYFLDSMTLQCNQPRPGEDNICNQQQTSSDCFDNYFCAGSFGQVCQSCNFLMEGQSCNCKKQLRKNCTFCQESNCVQCLTGYTSVEGECIINTCDTTQFNCQNGYYCPLNSKFNTPCQKCDIKSTQQCNCGAAKNCQTCSINQNECQTCLTNFVLNDGNCVSSQKCDSQNKCPTYYYCYNGGCQICDTQNAQCSCIDAVNCQKCGFPGSCVKCLYGWNQDQNGNCTIPICKQQLKVNQYCYGSDEVRPCSTNQIVINSMVLECYCGEDMHGCAYCLKSKQGCQLCMNGFTMMSGQCIFTPEGYIGRCDDQGHSSLCNVGYGCNNYGECVSCQNLHLQQFCKCQNDIQLKNCAKCEDDKCVECINGAKLIGKLCEIECTNQLQCDVDEMCNMKIGICQPCNGLYPCKCQLGENCISCDLDGKCLGCFQSYKEDSFGSCSLCQEGYYIAHINPTICHYNDDKIQDISTVDIIGCIVAIVIIIIAAVYFVYHLCSKPKYQRFQHNFVWK